MKIVVTGGSGQLGTALRGMLTDDGHEVYAPPRHELDLEDGRRVRELIEYLRPDAVVHAGALTNVDECERDPAKAYRINALSTRCISKACRLIDSLLVYVSTDFVFDGTAKGPYVESDHPNPINIYGSTKLAGERAASLVERHVIVRTAWLFGPEGRNFPRTILRLAQTQPELRVVEDQTGSPTAAPDLARAIVRLLSSDRYGTYHVVNSGTCSWHGLAKCVLAAAGIERPIIPILSTELDRPARRPTYSALSTAKIEQHLGFRLRHYTEAVREYVPQLSA